MSRIILHQHNDMIVLYDTFQHEIIVRDRTHDKTLYYYVPCALDDIVHYVSKCKTFKCVESIIDNLLGFTS